MMNFIFLFMTVVSAYPSPDDTNRTYTITLKSESCYTEEGKEKVLKKDHLRTGGVPIYYKESFFSKDEAYKRYGEELDKAIRSYCQDYKDRPVTDLVTESCTPFSSSWIHEFTQFTLYYTAVINELFCTKHTKCKVNEIEYYSYWGSVKENRPGGSLVPDHCVN